MYCLPVVHDEFIIKICADPTDQFTFWFKLTELSYVVSSVTEKTTTTKKNKDSNVRFSTTTGWTGVTSKMSETKSRWDRLPHLRAFTTSSWRQHRNLQHQLLNHIVLPKYYFRTGKVFWSCRFSTIQADL